MSTGASSFHNEPLFSTAYCICAALKRLIVNGNRRIYIIRMVGDLTPWLTCLDIVFISGKCLVARRCWRVRACYKTYWPWPSSSWNVTVGMRRDGSRRSLYTSPLIALLRFVQLERNLGGLAFGACLLCYAAWWVAAGRISNCGKRRVWAKRKFQNLQGACCWCSGGMLATNWL